jgi:hypothetical protein
MVALGILNLVLVLLVLLLVGGGGREPAPAH